MTKNWLVLFGVIVVIGFVSAIFTYIRTDQTTFLYLAVGIGIVLTVLAAVVFKMRGFVEMTTLHILYIAGFGWVVPMLWAK